MSPQAALDKLLRKPAAQYAAEAEEPAGALCSYSEGLVSIPRDGAGCELTSVLRSETRELVTDFEACLLRSPAERATILDEVEPAGMYSDPSFSDPYVYASFIKECIDAGITGLTKTPRGQVGVFFVAKKAKKGKLQKRRMILDCRRINRMFRAPPRTLLGSTEALSRLRIPRVHGKDLQEDLFIAQEDIRDFFYRLYIPRELGEWFCLDEVDVDILVALYHAAGEEVPDCVKQMQDTLGPTFPFMLVAPMGWGWAFYLAQAAHEYAAEVALDKPDLVVDRKPPPRSCRKSLY